MTDKNTELTAKELAVFHKVQAINGAKGGIKTKELHGVKHFKQMSEKRWGKKNA